MDIETQDIAAYIDGLPNICGSEDLVVEAMSRPGPFYLPDFGVRTEINLFVGEREARVTGEMQTEFVRL